MILGLQTDRKQHIHGRSSEDVVKCIMQKGELKKVVHCVVVRRSRIKNERRRSRGGEDIRLLKGGNFPFEFIIKELVVPPPPPPSQK